MMELDTVPDDAYIYRHIQSYQVLQRRLDTNSAWIQQKDNTYLELNVGGPYTIDDAHHVMVGDLWILGGQSNMRGYGFFDHDSDDNNNNNNNNNNGNNNHGCHVFQSSESWGIVPDSKPVHHLVTSPRSVHHTLPDPTVREPLIVFDRGASLAPAFVRRYQQIVGVPVGVVPCAHGGVTIQQWQKVDNDDDNNNNKNNTLYGAMVDKIRLVGGQYRGILWYQGESDAVHLDKAKHYASSFTDWFHQLQTDFPNTTIQGKPMAPRLFIMAQIGRMVTTTSDDDDDDMLDLAWSLVRQAQVELCIKQQQQQQQKQQRQYLSQLPWTTRMVSTLDADMDDHIHLSKTGLDKVGERMAMAAMAAVRSLKADTMIRPHHVTMIHLPYGNNKHWRHILRLDLFPPSLSVTMFWRQTENITGFTIHDTSSGAAVTATTMTKMMDMIYSARINAQQQVDLYITEKGYQQLVAAATPTTDQQRYVLWYGYGRNPQCNLVTTTNVAALAFGPVSIPVTSPLD